MAAPPPFEFPRPALKGRGVLGCKMIGSNLWLRSWATGLGKGTWIKDGSKMEGKKSNMWKSKNQLVFVQLASNHLSLLNGIINIPLQNLPENIHSTTPRKVLVYIHIIIYIYIYIYIIHTCIIHIHISILHYITMFETYQSFMFDIDGKNRGLSSKIIYHTKIVMCIKTKKNDVDTWPTNTQDAYLTIYRHAWRVSVGRCPGVHWRFPSCTAPWRIHEAGTVKTLSNNIRGIGTRLPVLVLLHMFLAS